MVASIYPVSHSHQFHQMQVCFTWSFLSYKSLDFSDNWDRQDKEFVIEWL